MSFLQRLKSWPWGKIVFYGLMTVAVTTGAIWAKKMIWSVRPIDTAPQVLAEAPQAAKVERIYIPGPTKILIYDKRELENKIPVPPAVSTNPQNQYTATASVPVSPYGGTAISYTNMSTGQAGIAYTAKPRPLFGFGGTGGVGVRGGVGAGNAGTGYTGGIYVRQQIVRVADVQISGMAELNLSTYQKPESKVVAEAELWSWR